jgi:hypothetical protein
MGPNDNPKAYKVTKAIADRRVFPEYEHPDGGAYTNKRGKGKIVPGSILYTQWYAANEFTIFIWGYADTVQYATLLPSCYYHASIVPTRGIFPFLSLAHF